MSRSGAAAAAVGVFLLVGASTAWAGSVKKVSVKKQLIEVDLEEDETVEKDTTICFFDDDGKKVDCGAVTKFKKTLALVKVASPDVAKKIKAGMAAKIGAADGDAPAGDDKNVAKKGKKKKKKKKAAGDDDDSGDDTTKTAKEKPAPFRMWGYLADDLITPTKYQKIGYAAPTSATPTTLWAGDKKVTSAFAGNVQLGIPVGGASINPGLRYRIFTPSQVDADFVTEHENPYIRVQQKATSIGFWTDVQFLRVPFGGKQASSFWLSTGLDFDQTSLTMTATKLDDTNTSTNEQVASATAKDTVVSLRLGTGLDFVFLKPLGFFIGLNVMVPVFEAGKKFSGSVSDDAVSSGVSLPPNASGDLQQAIGLGKNSIGAELAIGGLLAF